MTFSYTPGGGRKDDVRLLIGDLDQTAQQDLRLEDEDIERLLAMEGNLYFAAAVAADILSAKFARKAEGSAGPQSIRPSSRAQELRAIANRLRQRAASTAATFAGGLSRAERDAALADTDRIQGAFSLGMMSNPGTGATQ